MNIKKPRIWLLPLLCYAIGLLVWLGISVSSLVLDTLHLRDGLLPRTEFRLGSMQLEGVVLREGEDGWQRFVSTDPDPRIVYAPGTPFYATSLTFKATPHKPPGEMVLYYTNTTGNITPEQGFQESRKIWAQQTGDGSWYFDLGGRRLTGLRLDPDTVGGVLWNVERMVLNDSKPLLSYFLPDARVVFLWLLLPGLLAMSIRELTSSIRMMELRKKVK